MEVRRLKKQRLSLGQGHALRRRNVVFGPRLLSWTVLEQQRANTSSMIK